MSSKGVPNKLARNQNLSNHMFTDLWNLRIVLDSDSRTITNARCLSEVAPLLCGMWNVTYPEKTAIIDFTTVGALWSPQYCIQYD